MTLLTESFDYPLPQDRIAQSPQERRDDSRLLHAMPDGRLDDRRFRELPSLLRAGDLLVANDTKVRRARLHGMTIDGTRAELLVLEHVSGDAYRCLVRPARRLLPGTSVDLGSHLRATVVSNGSGHAGERTVRFTSLSSQRVGATMERVGESPLPPYIRTRLDDADRYQTTYARGDPVSAAAPTAGLHFTAETLGALRDAGIGFCTLQLEIGLATFAPIRTRHVDEHRMHEERFAIPVATAEMIEQTRVSGGRIVAVGTTVMRALEAAAGATGTVTTGAGTTRLFITPGHQFRVADALLTNFHQPRSSLLVLLAAFIGMQRWRDAYAHALDTGYRFLSLGDCMLCWRAA